MNQKQEPNHEPTAIFETEYGTLRIPESAVAGTSVTPVPGTSSKMVSCVTRDGFVISMLGHVKDADGDATGAELHIDAGFVLDCVINAFNDAAHNDARERNNAARQGEEPEK